ncbi:MAG TPA: carboxypeptidase-like regulatory domain-containing protein, partial [Vicinamibacterales bacterium]
MIRRSVYLCFLVVCLAVTPLLLAQLQTGNVFGKVQAKDGSVLPGVSVTLSGVGAPQTFVTDGAGNFHFPNLTPGSYNLKAELAGFGSATRAGVSVNIGRNADVTLTLNPSASESITVTAEAPLLDVRKAGTGADVTKVELEKVPTGRDPWVILQQTPGVLIDRINVGGNESGQQSNYVGKGSTSDQSTWNVDGVNITDVGALGSSPSYYDFDSFEELQITTGGVDPRIQTPGVQLNMVTKRGTNDFKGSARTYYSSKGLQATPSIPSEATYLSSVNQIDKINEEGAELGGPIIKDKLWFWGAYADQKINLLTSTLLNNGSRFLDKTHLTNEN